MTIELIPWDENDLHLITKFVTDPEMMKYLGGIQTEKQAQEKQQRYLESAKSDKGCAFKIIPTGTAIAAGCVVYWESEGKPYYEMGWNVFTPFKGRGLATQAGLWVIEIMKQQKRHPYVHAFTTQDNDASNAICRKLGFELIGIKEVEYPAGVFHQANNWRLTL